MLYSFNNNILCWLRACKKAVQSFLLIWIFIYQYSGLLWFSGDVGYISVIAALVLCVNLLKRDQILRVNENSLPTSQFTFIFQKYFKPRMYVCVLKIHHNRGIYLLSRRIKTMFWHFTVSWLQGIMASYSTWPGRWAGEVMGDLVAMVSVQYWSIFVDLYHFHHPPAGLFVLFAQHLHMSKVTG